MKEVQESLKTKIVDSPEKVKNYKEKMKDTVQKLKSSRVSLLRRVHALRRGGGPRGVRAGQPDVVEGGSRVAGVCSRVQPRPEALLWAIKTDARPQET